MPRHTVPDAWDDDWEPEAAPPAAAAAILKPQANVRLSKAERLALHEESNRKLWQSADTPDEQPQYLPATNDISPAVPAFRPSMKVLSRRPAPARTSGAGGAGDYDDDDEEARRLAALQPSPEEIRLRQQREREEKQRRYDEARAKIFGEPAPSPRTSAASSGASTPGAVTPPLQPHHHQHHQTDSGPGNPAGRQGGNRGRGRGGRGGGGGYRGESRSSHDRGISNDTQVRRPPGTRELYDPNSSPKPPQRRGGGEATSSPGTTTPTPREEDQVRFQALRSPKGPDAGGRGGFGFPRRGGAFDT